MTTYKAVLTNGETEIKTSSIRDYMVGIQGVTWKGELRLVGLSRTMGNALTKAARLTASGMESVKVIDLSRE